MLASATLRRMNISFFFNDTATTEIYTLSLHDALPILALQIGTSTGRCMVSSGTSIASRPASGPRLAASVSSGAREANSLDRKSTRLNSSHANISYAVFCLKKNKQRFLIVCQHVLAVHP